MKTSYTYRVEGICKAPAQVVGEVCEQLEHSDRGLTPAALVDASRPAAAPLHSEFEWDDAIAAEQYREHQAANIIRCIRVVVDDNPEPVRAFVNVRVEHETGQYVSIRRTLDNDQWRGQLLESAKRDAASFINKYRALAELARAIAELEKIVA